MVPANLLRGRVVDSRGVAANNCQVSAIRDVEDKTRAVLPLTSFTDLNGEFTIEGVRPGIYNVHPGPPRAPLAASIQIQLAGAEAWVELALPPTGSAKVKVIDFNSDEIVPKLVVTARRWQGEQAHPKVRDSHLESVRSDVDGIAIFSHLPPGEYSFTVQGSGYRQRIVRRAIIQGEAIEISVKVRALK